MGLPLRCRKGHLLMLFAGSRREPYALRLCEQHVNQVTKALPVAGLRVVGRYPAASTL